MEMVYKELINKDLIEYACNGYSNFREQGSMDIESTALRTKLKGHQIKKNTPLYCFYMKKFSYMKSIILENHFNN